MHKRIIYGIVAALVLSGTSSFAANSVCFTPGEDCAGLIVRALNDSKSELLVQSYSFTSPQIIAAIARAKRRGVNVRVILDKSNETGRYSGATYLINHGVIPVVDRKVAIAHNKVIIIDRTIVITGSFNFTKAAQERNAENVLVVSGDSQLVDRYRRNWFSRFSVSSAFKQRAR